MSACVPESNNDHIGTLINPIYPDSTNPNKKRPASGEGGTSTTRPEKKVYRCDSDDDSSTTTSNEHAKALASVKRYASQNKDFRAKLKDADKKLTIANNMIKELELTFEKNLISARFECDKTVEMYRTAHMEECRQITASVNELRFTETFGQPFNRGMPYCPVTQTPILAMEVVVALVADCSCNCIVKYTAASTYMTDFKNGDRFKCPTCRSSLVQKLDVTTAEQSQRAFAWRAVQRNTSCDTHEKMLEKRLKQIETDVADKTNQDTAALRALVEQIQTSAGTVMKQYK